METPTKEKIISELERHLRLDLFQVMGKQIFYSGRDGYGKEVLVCTPYSRLHAQGNGWIDLTTIQFAMLDKVHDSILAFRVEPNKVYYFHFRDLKPYMTKETMVYNKHEGDHWKIYVWPNYIQVLGNESIFRMRPNNLDDLKTH